MQYDTMHSHLFFTHIGLSAKNLGCLSVSYLLMVQQDTTSTVDRCLGKFRMGGYSSVSQNSKLALCCVFTG